MTAKMENICLGAILLTGLALRLVVLGGSAPTDDAYITFRYVRNIASGHGFVYNIGERVLGTTTPLFTILLVPFAKIGLEPDAVAVAISVVLDLGLCLLLYRLFRDRLGGAAALTSALFYALSYVHIAACGYGMETQLLMFLATLSILLYLRKQYVWMAVAAGLALLARPEGILMALILAAALAADRHRKGTAPFWRSVLIYTAVTAPWFLFALFYFGSPFPNSVLAKFHQEGITAGQWLDFFVTRNPLIMLLWPGFLVGLVHGYRKGCRAVLLLSAWAILYLLFFLVGRPPFLGGWYFPPAALPLFSLAAIGAWWILSGILGGVRKAAAAAALLIILQALVVLPRSYETVTWNRKVVDTVYRPLGKWIAAETKPDDLIHAPDIGYLGYISRRRILDASALVTPGVREFYASRRDDTDRDIEFLLAKSPDYVVLPIERELYRRFEASGFFSHYEPVERFRVEGPANLYPLFAPEGAGRADRRFMADFIVYRKI